MPPAAAASVRARFAREARLTARVQHPGVVKVLDDDVAGDRPYLVLEFVDGETLRERLRHGPLPVVDAARIAALTADVLAAAHAGGVLHRDVKPDNVMLARDGGVRVLDFGIARAMADDAPLTRTGEILGTPEYMAPEQLLDGPEATDERTDVHALGVLLYELLTARSPFHGANLFQALKLVESLVPVAPSTLRAEVPKALDAVVGRALQKRREDRYASAAAFAAAVREAVPEAAAPEPPAVRTPWRSWLLVAALFAVAAVGLLIVDALRDVPRALGSALTDAATALGEAAARAASNPVLAHQHLAAGQWCSALVHAQRGLADGDAVLRPIAQDAFLLAHRIWPLAAGLPPWLACCDERQRQRLFGDDAEATPPADPLAQARLLLARGECRPALVLLQQHVASTPDADARDRRLLLLAAHEVGADRATLGALAERLGLASDPAARLLAVRHLPSPQRAAAFTDIAALLPIDQPEHWLALRCAAAYPSDGDANGRAASPEIPNDAHQCAKMAWLSGAGELAVLLDAALRTLRASGTAPAPLTGERRDALLRRLSAEPDDAPASVALRALLYTAAKDFTAAEEQLLQLPANAPASLQAFQDWLVAARGSATADHATCRGRAQCAVGDFASARWQFGVAKTPVATCLAWLLAVDAPTDRAPPFARDAVAAAAELVRGDAQFVVRLLAAAADAPADQRLVLLRLAVLAGAEPDFAQEPWRDFADGPARASFDAEVLGGLRR
jgi:hypothetical protein